MISLLYFTIYNIQNMALILILLPLSDNKHCVRSDKRKPTKPGILCISFSSINTTKVRYHSHFIRQFIMLDISMREKNSCETPHRNLFFVILGYIIMTLYHHLVLILGEVLWAYSCFEFSKCVSLSISNFAFQFTKFLVRI